MLVSLVILGILASITLPYAEVTVTRAKEFKLRENLRAIRTAIDAFHQDWKDEIIERSDSSSSPEGYPTSLEVLVTGVPLAGTDSTRKYLRRIPEDPFSNEPDAVDHWNIRGYRDAADSGVWGGDDVYDVRVKHDRQALDGSYYRDW